MIDEDWVKRLAEDIISINCLQCKEFEKPLNTSCCWCEGILEVVDFELERDHKGWVQEDEDQVAQAWEDVRKEILGDGK